jgi:hypothetical protein
MHFNTAAAAVLLSMLVIHSDALTIADAYRRCVYLHDHVMVNGLTCCDTSLLASGICITPRLNVKSPDVLKFFAQH